MRVEFQDHLRSAARGMVMPYTVQTKFGVDMPTVTIAGEIGIKQ